VEKGARRRFTHRASQLPCTVDPTRRAVVPSSGLTQRAAFPLSVAIYAAVLPSGDKEIPDVWVPYVNSEPSGGLIWRLKTRSSEGAWRNCDSTQPPMYLTMMQDAGYTEAATSDGRLTRRVANRKWYAKHKGATPASNQVLLFRRPV
jgi:hypothetical protein